MSDRVKETEALYRSMMRAQPPAARLRMACRMFATAKALIRAGILSRGESVSGSDDLRAMIFQRLYGCDFDDSQIRKIIDHLESRAGS